MDATVRKAEANVRWVHMAALATENNCPGTSEIPNSTHMMLSNGTDCVYEYSRQSVDRRNGIYLVDLTV